MKYLVAISLFFAAAHAACPNACSEHGECTENDSCDCHAGFQGGDCSERVCLYNWAWVTTANGDLNFDGDKYDGTVYSNNIRLPETASNEDSVGVGGAVLRTQKAPGGDWESWPYYAAPQEGHFYMECSNRGLCDRSTGDCLCFDGYTGTACNRMACPEDCSDRGACQTVSDFDGDYDLWDRDMARSCKCDAGWTGVACQTRVCPHGNDVMTKNNELWEVQYVDIYTTCDAASAGSCQTYGATSEMLGGYARLTYTDHFGESYETAPIRVVAMGDQYTEDSVTKDATHVAADTQAALRALPNDVIGPAVTVTAQYCETTSAVEETLDADGKATNANTGAYRVQTLAKVSNGVSDVDSVDETVVAMAADGLVVIAGSSTATRNAVFAGQGSGSFQVAYLASPICIRLKVNYTKMPGDLVNLGVNHDDVTYFGETNSQDNGDNKAANVNSDVSSNVDWLTNSVFGYVRPSTVTQTLTSNTQISTRVVSSIAMGSNIVVSQATGDATSTGAGALYASSNPHANFQPGTRVKVECEYDLPTNLDVGSATAKQYRNLGTYTISSGQDDNHAIPAVTDLSGSDGTDHTVTIQTDEVIVDSACSSASSTVRLTQVSNVVTASTGADFAVQLGEMQETTGIRVDSGATAFHSIVHGERGIQYHTVNNVMAGYYILADETKDLLSVDVTATASPGVTMTIDGDGTMENVECGDRGLCQEDGTCKCFAGYTGDACQFQKAIAM